MALSVMLKAQSSAVNRRRVLSQAVSPVRAVSITGMISSGRGAPRCIPVAVITTSTSNVTLPSPYGFVNGAATRTTSK